MKRKDFLSKLGAGLAALVLALMVTSCAEEAVTQAQATEIALDHAGVTQEEAQTIALNHAGVSLEDAVIYRVKADVEDGRAIYDVEFSVGTTEYDYEIAQDTGEVLSHDADIEGWIPRESQPEAVVQTSGEITMEQAVQLVLDRVPGATAEQVRIEEDYDDGQKKYEGEVYYDQAEYEFEITSNGTFIEWSADYDD